MKHKNALNAIDPEFLAQKDDVVNDVMATLVFPCKGNYIEWTQENKYARSFMMGSVTGDLLSAGFPKFVNLGENPDNFPPPEDITDAFILEKMDGSLCIVDVINGELNMRTRGTHTYKTLDNATDFEVALAKHPNIEPWLKNHANLTLLFEIVTPNNRIVLDYPEIDFYLIGAINKLTYSLRAQNVLDAYAAEMAVKRPQYYTFTDLSDCVKTIKAIEGKEGVCMYMPDGEIFKIKGDQYLKLHAFKSNATPKNIMKLYAEYGMPSTVAEFSKKIEADFDWECWKYVAAKANAIVTMHEQLIVELKRLEHFVRVNAYLEDADFAHRNLNRNKGPMANIAFKLRKGIDPSVETLHKILQDRIKH